MCLKSGVDVGLGVLRRMCRDLDKFGWNSGGVSIEMVAGFWICGAGYRFEDLVRFGDQRAGWDLEMFCAYGLM